MYERQAAARGRPSIEQDTVADTELRAENVACPPETGLGQSAAEAEVTHACCASFFIFIFCMNMIVFVFLTH